jgi:hypothetical protein
MADITRIYVGRRRPTVNQAAAVAASLALLAGSLLASAVPVTAAPTDPTHQIQQPTPTPCLQLCAGSPNHR